MRPARAANAALPHSPRGHSLLTHGILPLAHAAGYLVFVAVGTAVMTVMPDAPSRLLDRAVLRVQPFYNIVQVVLCSYMTLRAAEAAASRGFSLLCNDFDPTRTDIAFVVHVFYLSKALDFFDTVQIILRKSWRQLCVHVSCGARAYHALTMDATAPSCTCSTTQASSSSTPSMCGPAMMEM